MEVHKTQSRKERKKGICKENQHQVQGLVLGQTTKEKNGQWKTPLLGLAGEL
jgi:hypothetical protein